MPRTSYEEEEEDDGRSWDDDPEAPDPSDQDQDEFGSDTIPCPYCRRDILAATDICPYCGNFISKEDAPPEPWGWVAWTSIILLATFLLGWLLYRAF